MNKEILKKIEGNYTDKKLPEIKPGYTVEIDTVIKEGNKQRIQKFKGLVIAVSGSGISKMITVRKISYGVGVEKKLPIYSPVVAKVKVLKTEPARRSKLYFMRDRTGKESMRIRKGRTVMVPEEGASEEPVQEHQSEALTD